jgi:hypothetical protein
MLYLDMPGIGAWKMEWDRLGKDVRIKCNKGLVHSNQYRHGKPGRRPVALVPPFEDGAA